MLNKLTKIKYLKSPLFATAFFYSFLALYGSVTWAHVAHAGSLVYFIKEKKALKTILADKGRKIVQRKEALTDASVEWVAEYFDEDLESGEIIRLFLAKDRKDGHLIAAAITAEAPYSHGSAKLVLGVSASGDVIRAAVLGVNQKYVSDFEAAGKKGWLNELQGIPVTSLIDKGKALEKKHNNSINQAVMVNLKDSAVLLSAFIHQLNK